jgi:predicted TIM-barrel fold metal-dependent hydrolase
MAAWHDKLHPVGWKVYTAGVILGQRGPGRSVPDSARWMLDDERVGMPFLARARDLGSKVICSHKGLSRDVDNGSPRDIGPCAKAFPELAFIVYHSGYEPELAEGPYTEETSGIGVNRLIKALYDNEIPRGGNVYAELGTTWFCLIKRPEEAAHLLGKLLVHLGADNIIWGSDSIWYGPSQPVIDAFRASQIPDWMQEEFGYPALTPEIKDKILCRNAARIYGFDIDALLGAQRADAIGWTRQAVLEAEANGLRSRALEVE